MSDPVAINPPMIAATIPKLVAVPIEADCTSSFFKYSPQCLHFDAATKIVSAQKGHGLICETWV
jgi:hypothetical protein